MGGHMKSFMSPLASYIHKYAEGGAQDFCHIKSWVADGSGGVEVTKAELSPTTSSSFVPTTADQYSTEVTSDAHLSSENLRFESVRFFHDLHQHTITVNHGGDSNQLLVTLFLPLYDESLCRQACSIIDTLNRMESRCEVMIIGLCADLRKTIHDDDPTLTPHDLERLLVSQKDNTRMLSDMRIGDNCLKQFVVVQNINAEGYALNLDADALTRIMGETLLLAAEKYDIVFTQATEFDRTHPLCSIGLSVLNLDKFYFANYLLSRSYLHILDRERVGDRKVDVNKVAVEADKRLRQHMNLFSDFYDKRVRPSLNNKASHADIVAKIPPLLQETIDGIESDLSDHISDPQLSLPEKKALLALILGYDDALLQGYLFNQNQPTIDNLDEEVARIFIEANNNLVREKIDDEGTEYIEQGPITVCCDEQGRVELPIRELQELRNTIRESTNYIRNKSQELEDIVQMSQASIDSEKRLTERGFVFNDTVYRFDVQHQEPEFDETYQPKPVTATSVNLRDSFTAIKDQGEIGACTVFAVSSIFEYILKKNSHKEFDLSESFVYYNVRHAEGNENTDTGSSYRDVIGSIGTHGICTERLHPYSKQINDKPSQEAYEDARSRRILKALNVTVDERHIKSALQEGYPVAVSLKIYNSFSSTTHGGSGSNITASGFVDYPTDDEISSGDYGFHAMVIVGYTDETKHFVVRNSWGSDFGDRGYCYIPYSYICNNDLDRMACIITEVDTSDVQTVVAGGQAGKSTIVQFNMNDNLIKARIIKNLLGEEQRRMKLLEAEYLMLRNKYESLMQSLGRQTLRSEILNKSKERLNDKIAASRDAQSHINTTKRPSALNAFDKHTFKNKIKFIIADFVFLLLSCLSIAAVVKNARSDEEGVAHYLRQLGSADIMITLSPLFLLCLSLLCTILYWWYMKTKRRRMEMELEGESARQAKLVQQFTNELNVMDIRFQVAGMIIDRLLSLRKRLDQKYQAMKSYIGNLSLWQQEEMLSRAQMESVEKNPFIPLLRNETLDTYFDNNSDAITSNVHLYDYFQGYSLDESGIIQFKKQLKEIILTQLHAQLQSFSILRHILELKRYPYLDHTYASSQNLFPVLDRKSEPFCQIHTNANTAQPARFIFVNITDDAAKQWQQEYPKHFQTTPISESITSVFKILTLRLQPLTLDELQK